MKKSGISLIVLIITIIIIIILAGAIILGLVDNNPISLAEEAKFKLNRDQYNSQLSMYLVNRYLADSTFDKTTIDGSVWNGINDEVNIDGTIKEYIPCITAEDGQKYEVQDGKLVYVGTDENEIEWANSLEGETAESIFISNWDKYIAELDISMDNEYQADNTFVRSTFDAGVWNGINDATNINGTIKEYVPSITVEDGQKFEVQDGELAYVGTDPDEIEWANNIVSGGSSDECASGHTWVDANYLNPKTCSVCGTTEGVALDIATATKHPSQTDSTDVGIGTDGQVVNLDLWYYSYNDTADGYISADTYTVFDYMQALVDGKIEGTVPQYINSKSVEGLCYTFGWYGTDLTEAPVIPSTIKNLDGTFCYCSLLTTPPIIPDSVMSMEDTFSYCEALTVAPTLPSNLKVLAWTFDGCTALQQAPTIPTGVIDMSGAFKDCNLSVWPQIPTGVTDLTSVFEGCAGLTVAPQIPNTVLTMRSAFEGCTSLTAAPLIPSSVTSMEEAFAECTFSNAPTLPNNLTNLKHAFRNCINISAMPTIPSTVTTMYGAFLGCTSLVTTTALPTGLLDMYNTFYGCTSLVTAPTIPSTVTVLGSTFRACTNLTGTVQVNATNLSTASWIFYETVKSITVRVPSGTDAYTDINNACSSMTNVTVTGY